MLFSSETFPRGLLVIPYRSRVLTTCYSTWIVLASTLAIVLPAGGPVAFFYGFFFCVMCNFCIAASLGEMASVWPTAGGQYHYSYFLSTEKWRCSMVCLSQSLGIYSIADGSAQSFLVGWINLAGWLTLVTTEAMFGGNDSDLNHQARKRSTNNSSSIHRRGRSCWLKLYDPTHSMAHLPLLHRHLLLRNLPQHLRLSFPREMERRRT